MATPLHVKTPRPALVDPHLSLSNAGLLNTTPQAPQLSLVSRATSQARYQQHSSTGCARAFDPCTTGGSQVAHSLQRLNGTLETISTHTIMCGTLQCQSVDSPAGDPPSKAVPTELHKKCTGLGPKRWSPRALQRAACRRVAHTTSCRHSQRSSPGTLATAANKLSSRHQPAWHRSTGRPWCLPSRGQAGAVYLPDAGRPPPPPMPAMLRYVPTSTWLLPSPGGGWVWG